MKQLQSQTKISNKLDKNTTTTTAMWKTLATSLKKLFEVLSGKGGVGVVCRRKLEFRPRKSSLNAKTNTM